MAKIDTNEFKPNSYKYREEHEGKTDKKPIEKVVTGKVKLKEKSFRTKMKETFIGEEIKDVKSYVIFDVVAPKIKELIVDSLENAVEMVFGVPGRGRGSGIRVGRDKEKVSYNAYYKGSKSGSGLSDRRERDYDKPYEYCDVIFDTRGDAEVVLDRMIDYLEEYEQVSIGDLYSFVGQTPPFTDFKYGWTSLSGAQVKRVRDGYTIIFPKANILN